MIQSLGIILIVGLVFSALFKKLRLPGFIGLIFTGILLNSLNLLSNDLLDISSDLRKIALIIILTRAGLSLDIKDLKKVGFVAILLSFIPALFEMIAFTLFAPMLFSISYLDAAILGSVIAAVSPAVVVPRMIAFIEEKRGTNKLIPQLIMASSSVDDIFVIVVFSFLLGLSTNDNSNILSIMLIPISIVIGIVVGVISGYFINKYFINNHVRDTTKVIFILGFSFLLVSLEDYIVISGLISVMSLGVTIISINENLANRLSMKFNKIWLFAEILLFVLVGASVNPSYLLLTGIASIIIISIGLLFRSIGVYLCLLKTNFNFKEKIFCASSFIPKATVQAAIGGIPLSLGLASGELILAVAITAIVFTAPLGAILIDVSSKNLEIEQ